MNHIPAQVIEIVRAVLSEHHLLRPDLDITADSSLDDLKADDIDRIGIALKVEERWNFIVSDKQEREWESVADIIASVKRLVGVSA